MPGCNGKPPYYLTAYGLAVKHGFKGTEEEWLESLVGDSAYDIAVQIGYEGTKEEWVASHVGNIAPELEALKKLAVSYCESAKDHAQSARESATQAEESATKTQKKLDDAIAVVNKTGIESDAFSGCYYRIVNGETEWINPPMAVGEEYRTTERYLGVPVYTMVCDCGAVPEAATEKIVSHGLEGVNLVLRCAGTLSSGNSLPLNREGYGEISVMGTPTEIILRAGANNASLSGWLTAQAQIWYTRH